MYDMVQALIRNIELHGVIKLGNHGSIHFVVMMKLSSEESSHRLMYIIYKIECKVFSKLCNGSCLCFYKRLC